MLKNYGLPKFMHDADKGGQGGQGGWFGQQPTISGNSPSRSFGSGDLVPKSLMDKIAKAAGQINKINNRKLHPK